MKLNKVILLGDSITQGLGSKKINFTDELQMKLGDDYEVVNLAKTGTMIDYGLKQAESNDFSEASVCVIVYGNVDAQIRPNTHGRVFKLIPLRFQKPGMLMPRPFYSKALTKRLGQLLDNKARLILSWLIRLIDGTEQWKSVDDFSRDYVELVDFLVAKNIRAICCSCVYIDERLFPECREQYALFNSKIEKIARSRGADFVDLFNLLEQHVEDEGWDAIYNRDHFHPNAGGYQLMANEIAQSIFL